MICDVESLQLTGLHASSPSAVLAKNPVISLKVVFTKATVGARAVDSGLRL